MTVSLSWIRRISSELAELNTIPLFGNAPPFDWALFSEKISSHFGVHVQIRPKEQVWKEAASIKKGLSSTVHTLPISITPIGTIYWMQSAEDRAKLTSLMMRQTNKPRAPLSDIFQEGFSRFLALQSLNLISEIPTFSNLTLQISDEKEEIEKSFCIDIEINLDEKSTWGRLVIPQNFRSLWIQHFSHLQTDYFPQEIAKQTFLSLSLKTGSIILRQDEWEKIQVGDFLLLDQGSYDARKGVGVCLLMLNSTPLFNAKIKQGKAELTDYAFYYEDIMENQGETPSEEEFMPPVEGEKVSLKETPIYVTIEIAKLKMTLDKLMHLTPGNMLELPVHPDQGVSLTVNGQTVGRAELLYLGEQLGIRILEI